MKNCLYLSVLSLLAVGCSSSRPDFARFAPPESLPGVVLEEAWRSEIGVDVVPAEGLLADSLMLALEPLQSTKRYIVLVDLKTGAEVGRTVYRGRGPHEMTAVHWMIPLGDSLLLGAVGSPRPAIFSLHSLAEGRVRGRKLSTEQWNPTPWTFVPVEDGQLVFGNYQLDPSDREKWEVAHLWHVHASGERVALGGLYDLAELGEEAAGMRWPNGFLIQSTYEKKLRLHPSRPLCVAATEWFRSLEVFDYAADEVVAAKRYESPVLEIERKGSMTHLDLDTRHIMGFDNLACDAEGIDCTWRIQRSDTLHFYRYDWRLRLREHYLIPNGLRYALVLRTSDGRSIYALAYAEEKRYLVRFDLP